MALIITGHQCSGTRLLVKLCNSHPDIVVTTEFGNFLSLGKPSTTYMSRMLKRWAGIGIRSWPLVEKTDDEDRSSSFTLNRGMTLLRNHAFVVSYLSRILRHWRKCIDAPVIEETLQSIFPGTRIVGDKYPDYVFELEELTKAEGLSIVVIYRDCRNVTNSALKKVLTEWREMPFFIKTINTAEKVAKRWVKAVDLMECCQERLYVIRYEDLVINKERELNNLGEWLGVDPAGFNAEIIDEKRIGDYKRGLSDEDLAKIMEIAGPTLARLHYL